MTPAFQLRPWTDVVRPHPDVASGDLAMGTYAANLATVAYGVNSTAAVYTKPEQFFASTYFTTTMRELLGDVLDVLAGKPGDRVLQLRTPFGGGKTHTLLALYHLATARDKANGIPELADISDPGEVRVAVLSGEYLDPQRGRKVDGRRISTLWGELAYQLGGWEAYESVLVDGDEGVPPGGEVLGGLLGGAPTLLLLDEVLIYVAKGRAVKRLDTTAGQQALIFLQNLTEAVNQQRQAAMVYSLQASVGEAVQEEGLLQTLEHIAARVNVRREPVSGDEVLRVVQTRLFESTGDADVRKEVARSYAALLRSEREATAETDDARREAARAAANLERRIEDSYPFHPALIDLMYQRWGSLPSYQRTRGALQFLATVTHALWSSRAERTPQALISPGDVDLADEATRASFFEQVGEATQYTSVIEADFLSSDAGTRAVDNRLGRDAPALERLRVGTRVGTVIALLSFGAREGDERGALEHEVVAASLVPGLDGNVVRTALGDLRGEALLYLHYTGRRYRFEPTPNLNKLIVTEQDKFTAEEVLDVVRRNLETALDAKAFRQEVVLWPADSSGIRDGVRSFLVAYLSPTWDENRQPLSSLVSTCGAAPRRFKNGLALALPNPGTFDAARQAARTAMAVESLLSRASKQNFRPEQKEELQERATAANRKLTSVMGQAYERIALPMSSDGSNGLQFEFIDLTTILSAGRGLHERVREALSQQVFDRLTPGRLAAVARLSETGFARCEKLADDFFAYFELTKLWSLEALRASIAEGVSNGAFGYAVGVTADGNDPQVADRSLVRVRVPLRADEVDLGEGAAVLSVEVARQLAGTDVEAAGKGELAVSKEPETDTAVGGDGTAPAATPDGDTVGRARVRLQIRATEDDLHTLQRALTGLRDIVRPGPMKIDVEVIASDPSGTIDRVQFQNRVRQHLEEDDDVDFSEEWQ
jgi:Protein of unknown function (DUF499)